MKNKLTDLNNHLFVQLERLNDESLTGDKLKDEINRGKVMTGIASNIIANGRLVLDAEIAKSDHRLNFTPKALAAE
jgi:hypothetical protein